MVDLHYELLDLSFLNAGMIARGHASLDRFYSA
jgi:hypothetical protein